MRLILIINRSSDLGEISPQAIANIALDGFGASATAYAGVKEGIAPVSVGAVRGLVAAYMLLFLFATTWPGAQVFNQPEPFVIGLPFNLFVLASLITVALGLLTLLYFSETRKD